MSRAAWTGAPPNEVQADTTLPGPVGICWLGDRLVVGDGLRTKIVIVSRTGEVIRTVGGPGDGPGEFRSVVNLTCSEGQDGFLVVDREAQRVTLYDSAGTYLLHRPAPSTPQAVPYLGTFALLSKREWVDSWLGAEVGPYLPLEVWDTLTPFRHWSADGSLLGRFGRVRLYSQPATTRAFNRLLIKPGDGMIWVLSLAAALLEGIRVSDGEVMLSIPLPVYHRGIDPIVEVSAEFPGGYRRNRVVYEPNVGAFDVLDDSTFVVVRFLNYQRLRRRTASGAYDELWPESRVEVVTYSGAVLESFAAPGRVRAIDASPSGRVAIISEEFDSGVRRVLMTALPVSTDR